jgi:hypothetical protein
MSLLSLNIIVSVITTVHIVTKGYGNIRVHY